ncbi:MAG: phosphotransferase [Kiloniellales bacterium]
MASDDELIARVAALPCWSGPVEPQPITGGITNLNCRVRDKGRDCFVRLGADMPIHGILRLNEQAAARAASAAGISPPVIYTAPGVLVTGFVEGMTLKPEQLREERRLPALVDLIGRVHREMPKHLSGPLLMFWVFQAVRSYARTLRYGNSRSLARLPALLESAARLEEEVGPIEVVFGHNDLLAANFIDDGQRLWLVDWDYAGFNSPLFDLANLASNNEYGAHLEDELLSLYFGKPAKAELKRRYGAMKCASLLREAMWSMVSEIHSEIDFDYAAYTEENLARFEQVYEQQRSK